MPTLREILDKQKADKEKANVKPILQSQAVPEKKPEALPAQTHGEKGNLPTERDKIAAAEQTSGNTQPAVVEQGPPAGLTGIALIRWKREHASSKSAPLVKAEETKPILPVPVASSSKEISPTGPVVQNEKPVQPVSDGAVDTTELRRNLEYLANNIDQKELVGQIIRTIAVQLKNNPALTPYMRDADVDLVVRGLRRSYAIVARKRSEQREAKAAKSKNNDEVAAMFKDAGFDNLDIFAK